MLVVCWGLISNAHAQILTQRGTFAAEGAEIVAYDAASQRLFITNGNAVDIVDISDVDAPTLVSQIAVAGGGVTSVAASNSLVAIAAEAAVVTDPGTIEIYDTDGNFQRSIVVGALPDMLRFTDDDRYILVANEGEPDGGVDPQGSVSIIDLENGVMNATVQTVGFDGFDGQENLLKGRGVRLFDGIPTSQDVEPEFIASSADSNLAFVTLQESNAFAAIDIPNAELLDILPLGLKNHNQGLPVIENINFPELPDLGITAGGQTISLGGLSGLWFDGVDQFTGRLQFLTVPDRGPNGDPINVDGDPENERPFALPDYQARIVRFEYDLVTREIILRTQTFLTRADGQTPITGLPNIPGVDEEPIDLNGVVLPYDSFGADLEGIVRVSDGTFWMVDEYRPSIYHFNANGGLIERYVPNGTGAALNGNGGGFGAETLPAEYGSRRRNRGFEAIAYDSDAELIYAFIQTPLSNPTRADGDASSVIRMLGIDPTNGNPVSEYVYLLEKPDYRTSNVDKIGDAVYAGNGLFYILERDSSTENFAKKYLYSFNLIGATNLLDIGAPPLLAGQTLEQHTPDELATAGISPVNKIKVANLPSLGYLAGDKPEGLALLPDGRLAILNDNDFGLLDTPIPLDGTVPLNPEPTPIVMGLLSFSKPSGLDPSDRDAGIQIDNHPVFGMHQPDSIASYDVDGETFFITAGEGDARDEDDRIDDLTLDATAFPDAASLQQDEVLGRLEASTIDGDLDRDNDLDRIQVYGSRSFIIWDQFGNLVFDSGDQLEQITANAFPMNFNANDDENDSFESRSDNKGPEPEAVTVGEISPGVFYAFVGLERIGGIVVYDVSNPSAPRFIEYFNNRDFSVVIDLDVDPTAAGDLSPEGLVFISAGDSPTGSALLAVANEVSGTTTLYSVQQQPDEVFMDGFEAAVIF